MSLKITIRQLKVVEGEKDDDDSADRLEPGSHKDNPKHVDNDDNDEEKVDEGEGGEMGSLETRTEEMQTPIPKPPRSPRIILSSDKNITQELTDTNIERKWVTTKQLWKTHKQVNQVLNEGLSQLAKKAIEYLIENNLKPCIVATIIKDRNAFRSEVLDLVSQEFNAQAPKIIEELFKNHVQSNVIQIHPTITTSTKITSSADLQQQLYFKMKRKEYAYHLEQKANFIENQIVWESRQEDIRRIVLRPLVFFEPQRNPNEPPRYTQNDFQKLIWKKSQIVRSRVIWDRVHDFQLGIESYQIKINLTAPTLTFPGIEAHEPYSIVDKPSTGLIYLNKKDEKWVIYLVEIMNFCDATLEKVLKEVKLKIFQSEPWKKPPLLDGLDRDIMRAFEREITKHLSYQEHMRRWESFMNGRPILPTMKRL
ncbi:hypothetical protein Tco_0308409 [Tanacetum coccineum]